MVLALFWTNFGENSLTDHTLQRTFFFFQPFEEATAPSSMSTEFESLEPQSLSSRIHESPNREFLSEAEVTLRYHPYIT